MEVEATVVVMVEEVMVVATSVVHGNQNYLDPNTIKIVMIDDKRNSECLVSKPPPLLGVYSAAGD